MGNSISTWLWEMFASRGTKKKRVLMVGLEDSGKTTILYHLKLGKIVPTSTTNCFNLESFEYDDGVMEVWDLAGRWTIRRHFYQNTQGVIFVIDLNDPHRLTEATSSLIHTMEQDHIRGLPVLILLNKYDMICEKNLPNESKAEFINKFIESLDLSSMKELLNKRTPSVSVQMFTQTCSAYTGEGLSDGIRWLWNNMA